LRLILAGMMMLLELAHDVLAETVDCALAGNCNKRHFARLSRLEADRSAGRNIEPHAARFFTVELQRRIGFEKMIMRADLDRPITRISDRKRDGLTTFVELDFARSDEHFAGDHLALI
jgi:hypothetical protein